MFVMATLQIQLYDTCHELVPLCKYVVHVVSVKWPHRFWKTDIFALTTSVNMFGWDFQPTDSMMNVTYMN